MSADKIFFNKIYIKYYVNVYGKIKSILYSELDDDITSYVFKDLNIILWEYDGNFYNIGCEFNIGKYADKIIENIK